MSLRATVMIPTMAGRAPTLELALASVLAQNVAEIEVFVMGDGVDDPVRELVERFGARDDRIRFFDHPKHPSRGEPNRHAALQDARGHVVCYLCDRDLMLAHHIETVEELLAEADFCHTFPLRVDRKGELETFKSSDLRSRADRRWFVTGWHHENGIPLSFAAHTLGAYRRLPHGWRETPEGQFTDIYMWQQFLAERWCRARTGYLPTILYFPRYVRRDVTIEAKREELIRWRDRMGAGDWDHTFLKLATEAIARSQLEFARRLRSRQPQR
ncbi:MAG: glycosyltransferase family 2 protein [Pseudomonadota bacterium]